MTNSRHSLLLPAAAASALVALAPDQAQACEPVTLCVNWTVELHDGFAGDYLTGDTTPARGNRVTIVRPAPEPPLGLYLNDEGCTAFETQYAVGHKVILYNDAVYGDYTHVRAFRNSDELETGQTLVWTVDVPPIGDDDQISVDAPIDVESLSNLMGVTTETLHRLDSLGGGMPQTPRNLFPFRHTQPNANAFVDSLRIGSDSFEEKFVIAHEIGHWLVLEDGGWSFDGSYVPNDDDCRFTTTAGNGDVGGHAIRSAEYSSAGMTEGFAQFVAVAAFNDPSDVSGTFRYYKELDPTAFGGSSADLIDGDYLVSVPDDTEGGVNRWTEQQCPTDFNATSPIEVTSEIDWMRFFWDFITAPGTQPTFWDVVSLYRFTNVNYTWGAQDPLWPNLVDAIEDNSLGLTQFSTRFENLEPDHELFND